MELPEQHLTCLHEISHTLVCCVRTVLWPISPEQERKVLTFLRPGYLPPLVTGIHLGKLHSPYLYLLLPMETYQMVVSPAQTPVVCSKMCISFVHKPSGWFYAKWYWIWLLPHLPTGISIMVKYGLRNSPTTWENSAPCVSCWVGLHHRQCMLHLTVTGKLSWGNAWSACGLSSV